MNTLHFLERLKAIATNGLNYYKTPYDKERYEELMDLASQQYAHLFELDRDTINQQFKKEVGQITPKAGVNGLVKNNKGELLLELRSDDNCWGIIGGWADLGETPEQSLKREFLEEANLEIETISKPNVFSRTPTNVYPFTSIHLVYECQIIGGTIKTSHESQQIAFKNPSNIKNWHRDHEEWVGELLFQTVH